MIFIRLALELLREGALRLSNDSSFSEYLGGGASFVITRAWGLISRVEFFTFLFISLASLERETNEERERERERGEREERGERKRENI